MTLIEPAPVDLQLDTTLPYVEEVADGVFAIVQLDGTWGLSNAALVNDGSRSIMVDTFFTEQRNDRLREITDSLSAAPPSFLVNTHHHGDHVHGNGWYPEALVVAHRATRAAIAKLDPEVSARRFHTVAFGRIRPRVPDLAFSSSWTLHGADVTVEVSCPGVAHCPGNSVVHIPERRVLFAGDLVLKGCTPSFSGGSAIGFRAVLERLRTLEADVIVPGHGPVCGPEAFDETERYVEFVLDRAAAALTAGLSPLEAARGVDLGEFARWHDPERIVGNLYRAMSELDHGRPFDLFQMWRDTEAYLGRPVSSRA
jgi:cyclase